VADEIILHHYDTSPFSEKVRVMLGIKGLSWRSVIQPVIMPKPELTPLTGGYRRIPVMQIGADVYCDTQIILRALEARHPDPSIFPVKNGLAYAIGFWSDRLFFMPSVAVVFSEIGDMVPEAFKQDRAKMSGSTFSVEAMKAAAPFARDQWRAHADFVAETLEDGRAFMGGPKPGAADLHAYMNFWWIKAAIPHVAPQLLAEFLKIEAWVARVAALGHGNPTPIDAKEALTIAKAATSDAKEAADPSGRFQPGDKVTVSADDYGRDPIDGLLVAANPERIVIAREDPALGRINVHFPRAGYLAVPR